MGSSTATSIPDTMKAMVLPRHGSLDVYEYKDVPTPKHDLAPHDVLIQVRACGCNNTDVNTRSGWYSKNVTQATTGGAYDTVNNDDPTWGGSPIAFPRIQGADAVGIVVAVGSKVEAATFMHKRVMVDAWIRNYELDPPENTGYFGSECDGGFAEFTKADVRNVAVVHSDYSDAELATFQCSYVTAEGMLRRANVGEGDTVLVPGASGGVGGAVVQIARLKGARVIAMASESKHGQVAKLLPDRIVPRAPDNLAELLSDEKVTVVADVVGGSFFGALLEILQPHGRYTCSGAIAGPMVEMDLRTFYLNDLTLTGSTRTTTKTFQTVVEYIDKGLIKPVLAATYPLSRLRDAQQAFIDKKHVGNIVVVPDSLMDATK